ncbi:MAG: toxic anion resistance protein [Promicromonosporaceae bacterium]|nr:toxic anion resistance protein [Promicromonosporaceae bacterium]
MTDPTNVDIDFGALFAGADPAAAPATQLERAVAEATVEPVGSEVATTEQKFEFRSLLTSEQKTSLQAGAPALAKRIEGDLNTVLTFGAPVMTQLNDTSVQLLAAQRDIKLPSADAVVNDLLREMDGFEAKYRNTALEEKVGGIKRWFRRTKASFQVMARESKPIADRLDLAEVKIQEMENQLGDNITRGQLLHKQSLEHMDRVVGVLAALEEVIDLLRADVTRATELLADTQASGAGSATWDGKEVSASELAELHANLVTALSETERTWADWRQQFFMGYANAPSTRNLVMTQFSLRRRLAAFRQMGIPQARQSLALWQQAALAKEGAELGEAVQSGVNRIIQQSFGTAAEAVEQVAQAAQAPIITEETVWSVVDSIRSQCAAIVSADKAGRALRDRNLKALESGETKIKDEFAAAQQQLAAQAINPGGAVEAAAATAQVTADDEGDFLASLNG